MDKRGAKTGCGVTQNTMRKSGAVIRNVEMKSVSVEGTLNKISLW